MENSAVEWFFNEMENLRVKAEINNMDGNDFIIAKVRLLQQAKAMERDKKIAFGKRCFYEGFEKAENDDANCFTAWRESLDKLLTFKSE